MSHHWVVDVLNDLLTYAQLNDMPKLADHLSYALEVAVDSMAPAPGFSNVTESASDLSSCV